MRFITAKKAFGRQELEAATHIASTVRKQTEVNSGTFSRLSLFTLGVGQARGIVPLINMMGLHSSAKPFWKHQTHGEVHVCIHGELNAARLTRKTDSSSQC